MFVKNWIIIVILVILPACGDFLDADPEAVVDSQVHSSTPTPQLTSKEKYVTCNEERRDQVPEFLDLFHDLMDKLCNEVEKAKIAKECPKAKLEFDRLIEAFYLDFALSLTEQEQLRLVVQLESALEFMPPSTDICSPEWIELHIGPTAYSDTGNGRECDTDPYWNDH